MVEAGYKYRIKSPDPALKTYLAQTFGCVRVVYNKALESLNVKGMVKNHSLALSIADVSWGELKRQLRYKAAWYGKALVEIDPWAATSKTCNGCGYKVESLPLSMREWSCPSCGRVHDRDMNAVKNVLAAGLAVSASGLRVNPVPLAA